MIVAAFSLRRIPGLALAGCCLLVSFCSVTASPAGQEASGETGEVWQEGRRVEGVQIQFRAGGTGFREHRAEILVCTDMATLEAFVSDAENFTDWVPFTRSARLLERTEEEIVYYVRSTTPWPLADRDMVYRVRRVPDEEGIVRLILVGLPDYLPEVEGVSRIRAARGEWLLVPEPQGVRVSYRLLVDPGAVPAFVANRRLASVVGRTLANLAAQFTCKDPG